MSPSSSAKALRDRRGARATLFNEPLQPRRTLGDDVQFVCWHGPASTIGQERQANPFLVDIK
jgi:hydroxyacylglutathione hydrolase